MMKNLILLTATVLGAVSAVGNTTSPVPNRYDGSTYANFDSVAARHISMTWNVDFDQQKFIGTVTHTVECMKAGTERVIFDYGGIDIDTTFVRDGAKVCTDGGDICYPATIDLYTDLNKALGNAVAVNFLGGCKQDDMIDVTLKYSTNNETLAINWLTKDQTAGKKMPYLFTQCESIACRTLAPMQDTPATKVTYDAHVTVNTGYVVKMSANETTPTVDGNMTTYHFVNTIKMPSYLIAIAVGDLEYRSVGARVGVITEPSAMDRVANELDTLATLLNTTEAYLTPYIWGNYSILILPPSFPFGGMENPLLTFASPTIITGDKS